MVAVRIMDPGDVGNVGVARDPGVRANPQDFGSEIGTAVERAGLVIQSLGATAQHLANKRQAMADAIGLQAGENDLNAYYYNTVQSATESAAPGAPNFYHEVQGQFDATSPQVLDGIVKKYNLSPEGQQRLRLRALQLQGDYGSKAVAWGHNEAVRYLDETTRKTIDDTLAGAAVHGDFATANKNVNNTIAAAGGIMTPERAAALRTDVTQATTTAFTKWSSNLAQSGFADRGELHGKWTQFEGELQSLAISDGEKDLLRQRFGDEFAKGYGVQHPQEFLPKINASPPGAADLIKGFEGYRGSSYFDVNHDRVGYGSDTITDANGNVRAVTNGDTVTRADAERDLARRVAGIDAANTAKYGAAWTSLDANTKAALTSVTYNYGELPPSLSPALQSGDRQQIASAVEGLRGDNGGINANRREAEAAVILGKPVPGTARGGPDSGNEAVPGTVQQAGNLSLPGAPADGPFKYMTAETWQNIQRGAALQATADKTQQKDAFTLGIETGAVTSPDQILNDPIIDNGDKATLLKRFNEKNAEGVSLADFQQRLLQGGTFNPLNAGDRKGADLAIKAAGGFNAIASGDPKAVGVMYGIYDKTGIVPENVKGAIEGMLRSNNQASVNTALSYLSALHDRNVHAFNSEFSAETQGLTSTYQEKLDYATPQDAAAAVMTSMQPQTAAIQEQRRKDAGKEVKKYDIGTVMNSVFDPSVLPFDQASPPKDNDAQSALLADYKNIYTEEYAKVGDPGMAATMTAAKIRQMWGPSVVNSGEVMKWPPEITYRRQFGAASAVGGTFDWMKSQIEGDLRDAGVTHTATHIVSGAKGGVAVPSTDVLPYHVVADERTKAEMASGRPPSYHVIFTDDNGATHTLTEVNGITPRRYYWDISKAQGEATSRNAITQKTNATGEAASQARVKNVNAARSATDTGAAQAGETLTPTTLDEATIQKAMQVRGMTHDEAVKYLQQYLPLEGKQ